MGEIYFNRIINLHLPAGQSSWLWGARKTGKTTFLLAKFPKSATFDLLNTDLLLEYTKRPANFRDHVLALSPEHKALPIIVDEVQKVPPLLDEIQNLIVKHRLSFLLCGSSARKLKHGHANLLGGRAWRYEMHPLVSCEVPDFNLLKALNTGLVPLHYTSVNFQKSLHAYIVDYLQFEIMQEAIVRNLRAFSRFLDAAAFSANQLINYSTIARDVGIDAKTVKEYFQILVDTHLGHFVLPLALKKKRQEITSAPKFYFFDVGLASALKKRSISLLKGEEAGNAFENFILMELIAYNSYRDKGYSINFWRTKNGLEVDFVISYSTRRFAIEVKVSDTVDKSDFNGLLALKEATSLERMIVVCTASRARADERGIDIMPYGDFLLALWADQIF